MYTFYRGTNFQFAGQMQNNGIVQDLTGATIQGKVYDPTGQTTYGTLSCSVAGDPTKGLVNIVYSGNSLLWPVGKARIDFVLYLPNNALPIAADPIPFRIAQSPIIG